MDPLAIQKEQAQAQTPLLLVDVTFADGSVRRWATHAVQYGGEPYEARVLRHDFFEVQSMSEQGTDQVPRLTVTLANADSQMAQLEQTKGFKGANVQARFVFFDLTAGTSSPDSLVVFSGYCNAPEEVNDLELKLTALNRMNMQRVLVPPVRIQRRCPWSFPSTAAQRQAANSDPNSIYYACGYAPDIAGGAGRFESGSVPFTSCSFTRQGCIERGMFSHDAATTLAANAPSGATSVLVNADITQAGQAVDIGGGPDPLSGYTNQEELTVTAKSGTGPFTYDLSAPLAKAHSSGESVGRPTRRFGGIEFVPEIIDVRPFGSPGFIKSAVGDSAARYNDHVPIVYGTVWMEPVVTVLRNDGNLTRVQALVSFGRVEEVQRVVVNDFEIPHAVAGQDMTGSGWYTLFAHGNPWGAFDLNFTDRQGNPQGDPYGSTACLSVVVPNKINDGKSVPRIQALVRGRHVERFAADGSSLGFSFTNNTAWVLLDLLKLARWPLAQIDLASFADAAAFCAATIPATDNDGAAVTVPRFQCNLVLRQRRTAAEVIQGVRNNARLFFTYSPGGKLQVRVEDTIAAQQASLPYGSNATYTIAGGWPAYVYGDTNGTIARRAGGASSVRVFRRPISDTPNRFTFEFQDAFNEYVQDSLAIDDLDDQETAGQEISQTLLVDGIPNFDQAARIAKFHLDKSVKGNTFVEYETSVKALGQQVGQIIALSYAREGWTDQLFRLLKIAPQQNYRTVRITAQIHDDAWYTDTNGVFTGVGRHPRQPRRNPRPPNPLLGTVPRGDGDMDWGLSEKKSSETDGTAVIDLAAAFAVPRSEVSKLVGPPTGDPVATVSTSGGSLGGNQTLFYRLTVNDAEGQESAPSFAFRAPIPAGTNTNSATLTGLRFDAGAANFNVYRGATPSKVFRIREAQAVSSAFTDTGFGPEAVAPPDTYFDHANLYWKRRLTAPVAATIAGTATIGNETLTLTPNEWAGYLARIHAGTGAGQVRRIVSNTGTTLTVEREWVVVPESDSIFAVEEPDWKFGSSAVSSPAAFRAPNQAGTALLIQGRAADEHNSESPEGLAVVTPWIVGGAGAGINDTGVPVAPVFGVSVPRDGTLVLSPISFTAFTNTSGIRSATYRVNYASELTPLHTTLAQPGGIGGADTTLTVASPSGFAAGDFIAIDEEALEILAVNGATWTVSRAAQGSTAASHADGARVDRLAAKVFVLTLEPGFFGTPESGMWSDALPIPGVRITSVELLVSNSFGDSPVSVNNYLTASSDAGLAGALPGLRTNRGGQFTFQIDGTLVIENDPRSALAVHADVGIRDLYAFVRVAPTSLPVQITVKRNGAALETLAIPAGQNYSPTISEASREPLIAGDVLSFDVTSVGSGEPGRDLTLVIRI